MELLLRVSLCLLTFIGKTLGDEIQLFATEDSDVILPCSSSGKNDLTKQLFDWKKNDVQEVFLYNDGQHYNNGIKGQDEYFRNRVEFFQDQLQFGNASIHIKNTKLNDNGIYSCEFPILQPQQKYHIKLVVGTCPKPSLSILKIGDGETLVQCDAHRAYPEPIMELHDSAGVPFGSVNTTALPNGKYFDVILKALVTKQDEYQCVMKQEGICHQIYSTKTLVPVVSGTCPKPSLSILKIGDGETLVQCDAHRAYPEPTMELHDSAGVPVGPLSTTALPNGEYFDVILKALVTKQDEYQCVMKQEGICHQIYSTKTLVPVVSDFSKSIVILGVGLGVPLILAVIIIVGLLIYCSGCAGKTTGDETDATGSERKTLSVEEL